MNRNIKTLLLGLFVFAFTASMSFAQHNHSSHSSDTKEKTEKIEELPSGMSEMKSHGMKVMNRDSSKSGHKMMGMKGHKNMMPDSGTTENESLVREGEIDLKAIDKNNDGKVFQDQMDWNVIADEPGECPLCGMNLKEVTLEKAKENLIKHNFKVK